MAAILPATGWWRSGLAGGRGEGVVGSGGGVAGLADPDGMLLLAGDLAGREMGAGGLKSEVGEKVFVEGLGVEGGRRRRRRRRGKRSNGVERTISSKRKPLESSLPPPDSDTVLANDDDEIDQRILRPRVTPSNVKF